MSVVCLSSGTTNSAINFLFTLLNTLQSFINSHYCKYFNIHIVTILRIHRTCLDNSLVAEWATLFSK